MSTAAPSPRKRAIDGPDDGPRKRIKTIQHSRIIQHSRQAGIVVAADSNGVTFVDDGDAGVFSHVTADRRDLSLDPRNHQLIQLAKGMPEEDETCFIYHFPPSGLEDIALVSTTGFAPLVVAGNVATTIAADNTTTYRLPEGTEALDVMGSLPVDGRMTMVATVRTTANGTTIVVPDAATGTVAPLRVDGDKFTVTGGYQPLEQLSKLSSARIVDGAIITVDGIDNGTIIIRRNGRLQSSVPSVPSVPSPSSFFISPSGEIAWISGAGLYSVHMGQPTLLASDLSDTACFHPVSGASNFGAVVDDRHVAMIDFRSTPPSVVINLVVPPGAMIGPVFPHGPETVVGTMDDPSLFLFFPFCLN